MPRNKLPESKIIAIMYNTYKFDTRQPLLIMYNTILETITCNIFKSTKKPSDSQSL